MFGLAGRAGKGDRRRLVGDRGDGPVADGAPAAAHAHMRIGLHGKGRGIFAVRPGESVARLAQGIERQAGRMARAMHAQIQRRTRGHGERHSPGEIDGRKAGIGRRVDPGVDRRNSAASRIVEPRPQPAAPVRTRDEQRGGDKQEDCKAKGARIALRKTGRGQGDAEFADAGQPLRQMQLPQFLGPAIAVSGRHPVIRFGDRPVDKAACPLQPPRAFGPVGKAQIAKAEIERKTDCRDRARQDQRMQRPGQGGEKIEQRRGREQSCDAAGRPQRAARRAPTCSRRTRQRDEAGGLFSPRASLEFART